MLQDLRIGPQIIKSRHNRDAIVEAIATPERGIKEIMQLGYSQFLNLLDKWTKNQAKLIAESSKK